MASEKPPRKLPRHPRVWWSRLHYRWPFVVWVTAVAAVGWLYFYTGRTVGISGAVEVISEEVAPLEAGRITKIHVVQGQQVKAGDVIVEMDTTLIDAEIADIKSDLDADQFEFAARAAELQARFEIDRVQLERQYALALNDAEVRLRDLRFQSAVESNRLEALRVQIKLLEPVVTPVLSDMRTLATLRTEEETLARNLALYPSQINETREDIARIAVLHGQSRQSRYQDSVTNTIAAHERASAAKDVLNALRKRKEACVLRASSDGTVSRVFYQTGDVVPAASPITSIIKHNSQYIIAFVPESLIHQVEIGSKAWYGRPFQSGDLFEAHISDLGPEVVTLPTRASPLPGQTVRGRRCTLVMDAVAQVIPGESLVIYLSRPLWVEQVEAIKRYLATDR